VFRRVTPWAALVLVALTIVGVSLARTGGAEHRPGTWEKAWATGDAEVVRQWFVSHTGPTEPVSGTVPGGTVGTQADADHLAGKVVTSALTVTCDCVLRQFVLRGADLTIAAGTVTVANVTLDGQDNADLVGAITVKGDAAVRLVGVEITGHHDGIRMYGARLSGQDVYVHAVSRQNPQDFHDDGIQVAGGAAAFTRSFVDMVNANTSAVFIKPDASPIQTVAINQSVIMGGGYSVHVHDGPHGTPRHVDLSDDMVAPGYEDGLLSTSQLTDPPRVVPPVDVLVSGTGRRVRLVDGARI